MSCQYVKQRCDEYIDNSLSEVENMIFKEHLDKCPTCHEQIQQAQQIREALHNMDIPPMRSEFAQQVINNAVQHHETAKPNLYKGLSLALAASLVFVAMTGLYFNQPVIEDSPAIVIGLNQTKNVKLLFDAKDNIDNVSISIELSENLTLAGYNNSKLISWNSQLQKGQNVLALPIMATEFGKGEVIARLEHGGKNKTFLIQINTQQGGSTRNNLNPDFTPLNV
ncbi:MAG: zf-HC2 domain-containing protein [Gammaproteobacteria bacterium]|nr:zf-HC2 domain-containing protein [Gammaproteobacteria bacterium]